jgi:very-short-patch-repair endonuclease
MELLALARRQHGVVSRRQALDAGLTTKTLRCHLDRGRWRRLHPGVYLTHSGEPTWTARASAAVLWSGSGAALSLRAAAYLWKVDDRPPPVLTVVVPAHRQVQRVPGVRVTRRRRIQSAEVQRLPVTSAAQTVIDLADLRPPDPESAVALAARAVQLRVATTADLAAELRRRRAHRCRDVLRLALGDIGDGVESVAEHHYVRNVERAHGLPPFERQVVAAVAGGQIRRDFESVRFGVIVEIDGLPWHSGSAAGRDRRRDRDAAGAGKVTLRAGYADVTEHPCELAVDIARTLWQRGWGGRPTMCGTRCAVGRLGAARHPAG